MKIVLTAIVFWSFSTIIVAQNSVTLSAEIDSTLLDNKYREDQFYVSLTYNLLGNKPDGISQNGFSSGFHFGFIRDMPINDARNLAFGLGLGVSTNSYNQTLLISKTSNNYEYAALDQSSTSFNKNKFSTYLLELPFEFRWRTSNATDYNFWRVYTGVKMSYLLYNSSKYKSKEETIKLSNINDFNSFQYGAILSIGYSNINIHLYYALNDIFKDSATLENQPLGMNAIKIGLIYYIL